MGNGEKGDDFDDVKLEFRRSRSEDEAEAMMLVPEQNAIITGTDDKLNQYLGFLKLEARDVYCWPNACQHRLMKITNKSKSIKTRSFLAFFLVDPDVQIVSTKDIPPQNTRMDNDRAQKEMETLMKERKDIKMILNKDVEEEISYCEH